ncbi:TetR/AcrR family transcriptional regulator [Actinotalea sp.]|uniref:TetR/AcrR family transcriptional regulator n=1 Tax=Actinotalea sp. TaxID=1872145 RepID=UPI00356718F8
MSVDPRIVPALGVAASLSAVSAVATGPASWAASVPRAGETSLAASVERSVMAPDERRAAILSIARELALEKGLNRTSISEVAERAGVTRGLVHHYLGSKDAMADELLDGYIEQVVASIREWDARREVGKIDEAVVDAVALLRRHLGHRAGDPAARLPRIDDVSMFVRFVDRCVDAIVDCLRETTVAAYAARHTIEIEHVSETFTVLLHGLIGLTRAHPDVDDDVLAAMVRQTLRLDATASPSAGSPLPAESAQLPEGER